MRRAVFCIFAATVAGTGLAAVLALGTAAVSAAFFKSEAPKGEAVFTGVQSMGPAILVAAILGFVVGAGAIVWMFLTSRPERQGPEQPGPNDRSEV